ncbi:magnesium-translocating P-type ATPase (plasmid) [Methylocystis sp. MJC1]|jgi:Mg2+-importing ATPase|uniref:magnesium-translocating P-type ATPase n=1 Tax=Methylocystis sp. MJC1 TaxID=2654282 RepID=UPI0013EC727B|nr:magnesium-translocating P-type ATPase [Methylocystis sp. MJC1]KAF2988806.1 Magnesium-transporting ATPase, P-type 1 [Methylocystis sp. MJC1]MBU6529069.1 magnesium-translocating P-type ATPase [Methylocystis sp. MJC1]UZX14009.1 magnesium-translocating P-type ATPase [Methylocystis sp. MJC1]
MTLTSSAIVPIHAGLIVPRFLYYFFAVYFVAFVTLWVSHRLLLWKKSNARSKVQPDEAAWWLKPLANHEADLATDAAGLTSAEARSRLAEFGSNLFRDRQQQSPLLQFLSRFKNPLVVLLLVASAISALTGEVANFLIISAMVLFSVTLDFVQEHRAGKAAESLRQSVSLRAMVIRDGKPLDTLVTDVVPGDLVVLSAGDMIPADGLVLEARDLYVKQALLTGEPYPVEKRSGTLSGDATDLQDAANAVFMGTSVISGSGRMRVVKTGANTAIGAIADSISRRPPPTAFEIGTHRFGLLIMRLTILLVLFVLLVNALLHKPWLESFLFAVALAVGLTPELLPMVVSVTLSRGALHMARKRVIVKRLASIQNLGSMDVLCTDKTGTLTEAKIKLEQHVDGEGKPSDRVLELAYLNSFFETGLKSPLDDAILDHHDIDVSAWKKIDEVPFDFERRRVSVLVEKGDDRLLVVKGASEEIVALCNRYEEQGNKTQPPLDATGIGRIQGQRIALEKEGFRLLGIAWRQVPKDHPHAVVGDEEGLVFAGFAGFLDPPKESAGAALAALAQSGVTVKIVTGDSELVTQHVCTTLKIPVTGVLTGKEIGEMDDSALRVRVGQANLFCRVNPSQKDRVILALKARGHVVGYLGDGINDAPSLHSADVGLSVDSAVDVAKEAADMILLDQDLLVVHDGVLEGRRTFANIMKYIMMGTSSNFGNMFSMAGAALFLPFLPMLPTQILLNNILYDISEVPIPLDEVDPEDVRSPHVLDMSFIRNFMLVIGPISSVFDFLTFYVMLVVMKANEALFQTGWFVESLSTQVLVIFIIRTRGNPFKSRAHPVLVATSLTIATMGAILPFTPLGPYFGFEPLPGRFYFILSAMVVVYLVIVEVAKNSFYRWLGGTGGSKRDEFVRNLALASSGLSREKLQEKS